MIRTALPGCALPVCAPTVCALLLSALLATPPLAAQSQSRALAAADLAIARGQFNEAESQLFDASMRAPRDPAVRAALGSFLAARGRLKVGIVLLEEARLFGGDARAIDERLAHAFGWLGEWKAAALLLAAGERSGPARNRQAYLAKHPSVVSGRDSGVVRLEPNDLAGLGRISLDVGGVMIVADIDPALDGVVLPSVPGIMASVELFGTENGATLAVAHRIGVGALSISNVPARLDVVKDARVGLDVLARLTPTFDAGARTLTVHATPGAEVGAATAEFPLLLAFPGVRIAARNGTAPVTLESAAGRAALRGSRWTLDLRRGAVTMHRR